ncbi:hypothetical protein [Pseudomonas sp. TWI929]|uniref:hypothetical protein n=1 Tax=Pseudomonas sp. TWI929 TaxID=3136795 RepID=UPI00320AC339
MPVTSLRKPFARPPEVAKIKIKIKIKIKSKRAARFGPSQTKLYNPSKVPPPPFSAKGSLP